MALASIRVRRRSMPREETMDLMFLNRDEIATLTGRKSKGHQVDALRKMGIPFFVNACGQPVVTRVAVEGRPHAVEPRPTWSPPELPAKHSK
jgi:hypothetical protein